MLVLTILALIAGLMIGLCIGLAMQSVSQDAIPADRSGVVNVLPDTKIEKRIQYSICGHTLCIPVDAHAFVGYTEEEMAQFYDDMRIDAFSAKQVLLQGSAVGFCPNHYVLCLLDGALFVCKTNTETLYFDKLQALSDTHLLHISDEMREALEIGVAFDSLAEINAYLENSES